MANDCLITKLTGEVQNDSLHRFDCLRINVDDASNSRFNIRYKNGNIFTADDVIIGTGVSVDFTSPSGPRWSGTGIADIKKEKDISIVSLLNYTPAIIIPIEELSDCVELSSIESLCPDSIELTELKQLSALPDSIVTLKINSELAGSSYWDTIKGNIGELRRRFTNVETIDFGYNRQISGTMEQIAMVFPKLTSMETVALLTGFTGDIIDFVTVRRNQGKYTGEVMIKAGNYSGIKFNGNALASGNVPFSWTTSPNTITYNGTTIDA